MICQCCVYSQQEINPYITAYRYIDTSLNVKEEMLKSFFDKRINKKVNKDSFINLLLCKQISYMNLSSFEKILSDSTIALGIEKTDASSRQAFYNKYYFKPFNLEELANLNTNKLPSNFYLFFSKLIGRVIIAEINYNSSNSYNKNNCSTPLFGKSVKILFVFNADITRIEKIFFSSIIRN